MFKYGSKSLNPLLSADGKTRIGLKHVFWGQAKKAKGDGSMALDEIHQYAEMVASRHVKELFYNASTSTGHLRQISSVLYLNDTYTGGEIDFPNLSIKMKPKAGTLIAFPSQDQIFLHQVLEITSGKKWVAPCFWSIKD